MPAGLRSALHRQVAQALAGVGAPAERVAGQLLAAPDTADAWAVDWLVGAGPGLAYRAPQLAVELLERARGVAAPGPRRDLLDANLITALFLLGRYGEVERLAAPVLAGTWDAGVAARVAWALAFTLLIQTRFEPALAVVEQALRDWPLEPVWEARMRALRALVLHGSDRLVEAEAAARQAEAAGERAADRLAVGYTLHALSRTQFYSQREQSSEQCLDTIERALAVLGPETNQPEANDLRLLLLGNRAALLDNVGRPAEADEAMGQAMALADRVGAPPLRQATMHLHAADHNFFGGRWDDALAELDVAADILPSHVPSRSVWLHGLGALIAVHRDDRAALGRHRRAVADLDLSAGERRHHAGYLLVARALAAERDGQPEQALAQLLAVLDPTSTREFTDLTDETVVWAPDVVRLALAVGDLDSARATTEACTVAARRRPAPPLQAAAAHCQGLLAGDPTPLQAAADTYHQAGRPLYQAQALENAAVLFTQQGQAPQARAAYTQVVALYTPLGAAWNLRRADSRLRSLGIRRGARGARRRPTTGWAALSPSELAIARLVASGRSNPDIATELYVSRSTVETHISHILTKLDAHSRLEIAREVAHHEPAGSLVEGRQQ
jgi:DNA-binding CsgD family transcriptional regulator